MKKIFAGIIFIFIFSLLSESLVGAEELQEITIEHTDVFMENSREILKNNVSDFLNVSPEPIFKTEISAEDSSKPFLSDKLHFQFEKGPIEEMTVFGAYRGNLSFDFLNNGYHTNYNTGMIDLGFLGKFREVPVDYKLILNFNPMEGLGFFNSLITDSFIVINAVPKHKIHVGHMRTPIGIEGGKSGYVTPFLNRSQISRNLSNVRTLGVKVIGEHQLIDYNVGVYSSDRYFQKFFPGAEFTGWVNVKPLAKTNGKYGKVVLGTGLNAGHKDSTYTVGGLYAGYEYKKLNLDFEYSAANGYNNVLVNSRDKAQGFYSTAYYKLTDKVQVLARYDQFIPNMDKSHNPQKEYTAGVNYFIRGHDMKIMLNYVYYENFANSNNGSRLFLGTQVLF